VKQLLNGPESFTPDGNFILGEAPEIAGYYVGAGFNAFGIAAGGGAGKALAEWILGGEPPYDLWPVDIRRFGRPHADIDWVRARTHEMYGRHYTIAWPHEESESSRPYRRSLLYDDLVAAGACFGEKLGWERPNWFAPRGVAPLDAYSFERQNWFPHVREEHRAVRERVGVFDQTSFAKFVMKGADAERALGWICANDVTRDPGAVVYTQLLNSRGGIECDLTVARIDEDRYYIVTGTGFASHDFHWIRTHVQPGLAAELTDVTDEFSVISVFGPRSRDLLSSVTDDDLGNDAFPFASVREIRIAGVAVTALRITYVGELGWELHVPIASACDVYRSVMTAGEAHGVAACGYRAIESLRLEKGYRAWSSDLTPDHSPLQAGLGFAVKLDTNIPFLGREALVEQRRAGLTRRLACFTTEDNGVVLLGRETIYRDGERVGWLTSGGYGYTVDESIGYGYVRNRSGVERKFLVSGDYELEVANRRVPARIHFGPLYDPRNERIRA
jgi:4-methylaminobutanoate oxidase (formaldehyde-forming)